MTEPIRDGADPGLSRDAPLVVRQAEPSTPLDGSACGFCALAAPCAFCQP